MDFFNEQEIEYFSQIAYKTYDASNFEHFKIAESLKYGLWDKTYHWAEEICKLLPDFTFNCRKYWQQQSGPGTIAFKSYTWAKIYKTRDEGKEIYFTVGADADEQALIYKFDYQSAYNSKLDDTQKQTCKDLIKTSDAALRLINLNNLKNYDWTKLIGESVSFIKQYESLYDSVINTIWHPVEKRVSRLTWNTNGWVMPSGPYGKSTSDGTHEKKHGYGHEEWLFDTSKIIDDYHYGFLEPVRKGQNTFSGKLYNVWLYTIDGTSKKRYWVGEINRVEVIDNVRADKITKIYKENGWLQEMEDQITASGAKAEEFAKWQGIDLFNICYKVKDLRINDPYYELPKDHPLNEPSRYVFMHFKDEFRINTEQDQKFAYIPSQSQDTDQSDNDIENNRKTYIREPKTIEITYLHKTIQTQLVKILREKYGSNNVNPEHKAYLGAKRIDIVVKDKDEKLLFYEIKTYISEITSIREAIGQLFEYAYWPDKNNAKELIIITQRPADLEKAVQYIVHLKSMFNIPLYYQWFDTQNNTLSEKY